jgi:hypothetical protein
VDLHRVRRLAGVLVASQIRSGRSSADPKSLFGRPLVFGILDASLFLVLFAATALAVPPSSRLTTLLLPVLTIALPFIPLFAVAAVLVAGVMFELTATVKFAGSDAVNWLPLTPGEYVAASSTAIAYTYSPALALLLGPLAALSLAVGLGSTIGLVTFLGVVGLFEGAFLVEMVRSATQRAGATGGHRGRAALVFRGVALLVLILALQLAFNPVFLFDSLHAISALGVASEFIPVFWSTHALTLWLGGNMVPALGFVAAQLAFTGALLFVAARLRVHYWVLGAEEFRFAPHRYAGGHPFLATLGLSRAESAIVTKDLRGLTRRREMLPMLVVPVVIFLVLLVENSSAGPGGLAPRWAGAFVGWAGGFLALLLATTCVGQERRAFQVLYAAPLSGRSIFRAKTVSVLVPALAITVTLSAVAGVFFRLGLIVGAGMVVVSAVAAVAVAFWGLAFAARYSDFQERPRPQYLRPGAMVGATFSGMVVLFGVLLPGAYALGGTGATALAAGLLCMVLALVTGAAGFLSARLGFDRLYRELPF